MKIRKYRTRALGAIISSAILMLQHIGFMVYFAKILWIFPLSFVLAIPVGIYVGRRTIEFIKDKIIHNKIMFRKEETAKYQSKYLVYGLILGNISLIGLFVVFVLGREYVFRYIIYLLNIILGFWGILVSASLYQYVWVHLWEKRNRMQLLEDNE